MGPAPSPAPKGFGRRRRRNPKETPCPGLQGFTRASRAPVLAQRPRTEPRPGVPSPCQARIRIRAPFPSPPFIPVCSLSPLALPFCLTALKESSSRDGDAWAPRPQRCGITSGLGLPRPGKTWAGRGEEMTSGSRGFCASSPPPRRTKQEEVSKSSRGREGPLHLPPGSGFCIPLATAAPPWPDSAALLWEPGLLRLPLLQISPPGESREKKKKKRGGGGGM